MLLQPLEKEIPLPNGGTKSFVISKFPATVGREIITQYPTSAAPKIGDYRLNEDLMFKLLCYVGVPVPGQDPIMLTTRDLVNNHVPDWETLVKIEWAMMQYNSSFFENGKMLSFLDLMKGQLEGLVSKMLTSFVQSLSKNDLPPSGN